MFIYTMAQQWLSQYALILTSKELMEVKIMVVVVMEMVTKAKPPQSGFQESWSPQTGTIDFALSVRKYVVTTDKEFSVDLVLVLKIFLSRDVCQL